ncbi:hypothetical protein FS749_003300 [Ceratobasidium sp. UAMH 11750]|nr:hypothetical protein FS749_003300 [Ceratobasidium sp. UAMH 11750]
MPISRRSYSTDGQTSTKKWTPHRGRGRKVIPGHQIHWTVRASLRTPGDGANSNKPQLQFAYEPKAKLRRADNAKLTWGEIIIEQSSAPTADSIPPEESPKAIRKPAWEGGKYLIDAIDLVKDGRSLEPLNRDGSERWVEKLGDYITNDGKPELIWTYGGPSLLHKVAAIAQSQKARAIIRSVVGLKYEPTSTHERETDPESQVKKQKQEPGPSIRTSDNSGNSINGKWSHRG